MSYPKKTTDLEPGQYFIAERSSGCLGVILLALLPVVAAIAKWVA